MNKWACRIVVLHYNGRALLERCLPTVATAAKKSRRPCRVTVLDNGSTDDSQQWTAKNCPEVDWVISGENRVLCSYNAYANSVEEEVLIFLNNDIRVDEAFVDPLVDVLEADPAVFFAAPRSTHFGTDTYEGSLSKMELRWGLLWGSTQFPGHEIKINRLGLTMQCGFGAFRRDRFLQLSGYDDLYLPGTVEDSDLCFRGYRRGWIGRYVPDSRVEHMGQMSFKIAFGTDRLKRINRRNLYLFMWKNIRDPFYLLWHGVCIPFHLIKYLLTGSWPLLLGFFDACALFPVALKKRIGNRHEASVISDRQIFNLSRQI